MAAKAGFGDGQLASDCGSPCGGYLDEGQNHRAQAGCGRSRGCLLVLSIGGGRNLLGAASARGPVRADRTRHVRGGEQVGAAHETDRLHHHGHCHGQGPPSNLLALVLFMLVVVATPRGWWPAFLCYAALLAGVVALSRVPVSYLAKRIVIETPFLVFALAVPFIAEGPRVEVPAASPPGTPGRRAPRHGAPRR